LIQGGVTMSKVICAMALAVLLLITGKASAELVCYQLSAFPNERYKLDIQTHSLLSEVKRDNAEEAQQLAFSVFGKHVGTCGADTVRPVVGSLISIAPVGEPFQARLGLESFNTTGVPNFCRDVEVSCKAARSSGFPPPVWDCFGQNKFDVEFAFQLTKVDEEKDPRCGLFEDGMHGQGPSEIGPASGLDMK
jgi:hypothetical protein